jgi:hypothetical protein
MRWKHASASVTGKSHSNRGEEGQDACRAGIVHLPDAEFFIGIAADGAGSTTEGGRGAEIACGTLFLRIAAALQEQGSLTTITEDDVRTWVTAAREAIAADAQEQEKRLREYACTVLGAAAGNGRALFFQIGDGAIVTGHKDAFEAVFWPDQGEYANTTFFITDEQYLDRLRIVSSDTPEEIALFTDGLQNLVLSFSQKKAHAGFFVPLFSALQNSPGDGSGFFSDQLKSFLSRDDISMRSDDDRTLVLAMHTTG